MDSYIFGTSDSSDVAFILRRSGRFVRDGRPYLRVCYSL